MKRFATSLATTLLGGILIVGLSFGAQASPITGKLRINQAIEDNTNLLQLAGYYDNYYQRHNYDRNYRDNNDYDDDYEDDSYGHGRGCGYTRYRKKYVCEESVPRCFKQRKCIWYYGREYCRNVRKCVGGGDRYCKWIKVPVHGCW